MSISLIIPAFSYGPPLERTWETFKSVCDELVIISTAFWEKDRDAMRKLTDKVVILDWNYTMLNGFGEMMNRGTGCAKNDWLMLFGVGETFHYSHVHDLKGTIVGSSPDLVLRVDHDNDPNRWTRIWNRKSGNQWSGIIHESITGTHGPVVMRMRDTPKESRGDKYEQETLRYLKLCLYHEQYRRLREDNSLLGATDPGWIQFVNGGKESNDEFMEKNRDMVQSVRSGDLEKFLTIVRREVDGDKVAIGVNFNPTGEPMSQGA
jgi:hypothetical protein